MSGPSGLGLSGVPATSLAALYLRAEESRRPDTLLKDETAEALAARLPEELAWVRRIPLVGANRVARILLTREMDRYARDFPARRPGAAVVHIGCGLDSRFQRVDDGRVEWYDLDLPEIIAARRQLLDDEGARHHLLACSVFDPAWLATVDDRRPLLFLAEVVLVYFEPGRVKWLVQTLRERFPGAELVFDACSPLHVWVTNRQLAAGRVDARFRWGIWRGREVEGWAGGIRLLGEWGFMDRPEPRLGNLRWLRPLEAAARTSRIYHFQLGEQTS